MGKYETELAELAEALGWMREGQPLSTLFSQNGNGLALGKETDDENIGSDLALRYALERGYRKAFSEMWETEVKKVFDPPEELELIFQRVHWKTENYAQRYTWSTDDAIIEATIRQDRGSEVIVFTNEESVAKKWIRSLKKHYRVVNPTRDPHGVDIHFWSMAHNGPSYTRRKIVVPKWKEIDSNYSENTLTGLTRMMNRDYRPDVEANGQLILWHGDPGTGKTYAIRALANAWRDWCDFEYIVDPEKFFGSESSYLMSVLLGHHRESYGEEDINGKGRWRALIFEDTGELLTVDAKERSGQGLSRLLNVVDGIIGQGLRLLVIITTNEDLSLLHPAVSRPGRTASIIQFSEMNSDESQKWAKKHHLTVENKSHTLAELFGTASGFGVRVGEKKKKLGFTPS